ncbi:MAG: nuclear transport factor 2 family protein [Sciscionella sp.]|nr:nuclear transport factor 2 family protein [Sciscionella sp.]
MNAADQLEIRDLTARFTDAVNRAASADLAGLFIDDGAWHVPGLPPVVGHAAIAAQLDSLLDNFTHLVQLTHSGHVEVDGDDASAVWYITESAEDTAGNAHLFTGVYTDRLTHTAPGWRFRERSFAFLHRTRTPANGKWYPHPGAAQPGRLGSSSRNS